MTKIGNCEDCGGTGIDPGSLNEPDPCIVCKGTGKVGASDERCDEARGWCKALGTEVCPQCQRLYCKDHFDPRYQLCIDCKLDWYEEGKGGEI